MSFNRTVSGVLLLSALFGTAVASEQSPSSPPPTGGPATVASDPIPDIAYEKFVLANGLTVLVHEDHKAPIVAVNVWYHVGSKNEKAGRTGFAHLFEHLMFNGSEHLNDDYFKAVEPLGATDLNGTTNEDRTNYFQNVPVTALDRILWLESDRMGHLLGVIDRARLDEQRGVVQNEKRMSENGPYGKAGIMIAENTFPQGHPYSWSVIGSMEDLSAASLDDVKHWFQTYYGPSNATIVLAGDIDPKTAREKVEKYFGAIPPGPPVGGFEQWVPKMIGVRRQQLQDRVPHARIYKVWNVPPFGTADATHIGMLASVLGRGKSSRLYKRLVYRDRLATDVDVYFDEREIASQVIVWATAQPGGDLAAVEKALDEEVSALLARGPTPTEIARVQTDYRARFVRGVERIGGFDGKSDVLARGQVLLNRPEAYKDILQTVLRASPASVQQAAARWMSDGVYVLEVHPFPTFTATTTDADRTALPGAGTSPDAPLPPVERATLSNGMKVVLARRQAVPIVRLTLLVDAGYAADDVARPGVSSMTMAMLEEGTASRSALQIADELSALGAQFWAGSSLDSSTATLSALKDRLDPSLGLFADLVLHPAFPEADLARVKQNSLARIQQEKVDPFGLALRVMPALLYGRGHAYGQPLTGSGTEASVQATTRADLATFHSTWFKPNHATLVTVGDVTLAELTPRLERAFAAWKPGDAPAKNITTVPGPASPQLYLLDRPGAEQSVILVGALVPPKANPDEYAYMTFNDVFGGSFSSRVNMNLREDKHWAYGAGSFAFDARGQRPWIIYAPVQTDKTKESVQEVLKELREVTTTRPLSADELDAAKDRMTRSLAGRWETGSAVSGAIEETVTFGLPDDYYASFAHRVRAVTPEAVAAAVGKAVSAQRIVIVVVGDRAAVEPGLKDLGLGAPRRLDGDGQPIAESRQP
jgi:zinc protease